MDIKGKLQQFEKKVSNAESPSQDFYNLIGIELYDFIESNDELKNAFLKHSDFLIMLSKDPSFITLQDNTYDAIQEALKFTDIEEINEIQKVWNNRLISKLKNEGDLTLPELFLLLKDKNSYYRLGDNCYTTQGELSLFVHIIPIRTQYELVGAFLQHHILRDKIKKGKDTAQFQEAIKRFGNLINQLDDLIYKQPIKLHIKDFEEFIIFCAQIYPRKGYEIFYEFRNCLPPLRTPPEKEEFERKKKSCLIVIDDLITEISNDDEKNKQNIISKIMTTKPPSFTMDILRPLANLIAQYTSPSQVISVAKYFGFEGIANNPAETETLLLRIFETLCDEQDNENIGKIIEKFLTLYGRLVDEKNHEKGFIGLAREILYQGHFNIAFHTKLKTYLVKPFEGPVHGIVMKADGTTEEDFISQKKPEMHKILSSSKEENSDNENQDNQEEEQNIKISEIVRKKYKDIKLEPKNKKGMLQLKKSGKWINLGGYNTRLYKMVKYILMPSSKSKMVDDVFEYIRISKDDKKEELQKETPRSYQLKKDIIEECVDTLQKAEYLKGHIKKPEFDDKNKTVIITFS